MALVSDLYTIIDDEFASVSPAEKLRYIQRIDTEIRTMMPLAPATVSLTALVADTQEYALTDTVLAVWSARYLRTSTVSDSKQLIETSVDELDQTIPNWRGKDAGEPDWWYVRGRNFGLYLKPDTSSSASYPQVQLETSSAVTLTASSTMPQNINDFSAWTDYACYRIARARKDERVQLYHSEAKQSLQKLIKAFHGRSARLNPKFVPKLGGGGISRQ